MGFARMAALAGACALAGLLTACGSSTPDAVAPPAGSGQPASASTSAAAISASPAPDSSAPATSESTLSTPLPTAATSAISIPPNLCDGTDAAQNTADAFMGALSAGNEKQATACVLPKTVPPATVQGLLATQAGTAVYLPRTGVDGPSVFGYQGGGKSIDVTVTKESDGKFWITGVIVRNG